MARVRRFADPIESYDQRQSRLLDQTNYDVPSKKATPESIARIARRVQEALDAQTEEQKNPTRREDAKNQTA